MNRLLLVEDDTSLGETLKERLERETYLVTWSQTLGDAEDALHKERFDLIILDVGMPDGSGFDFVKKLKDKTVAPFIFVTAMASAPYRLEGFELGAEEFIPKPFHLKEMLLRVRHVLENHAPKQKILYYDKVIDFEQMAIVSPDGKTENLPSRDFSLLKLLIHASPRVVSRDEILDTIWGEESFPSNRTVDNIIVRLRNALGDEGSRFIRSVRGVGYQWCAQPTTLRVNHG